MFKKVIFTIIIFLSTFSFVGKDTLSFYTYRDEITEDAMNSKFLKDLAMRESSGKHYIRSGQYLGLYQIGRIAFKDINVNIDSITEEKFLNNPHLQTKVMIKLMKKTRKYMKSYIKKYSGKVVGGIKITESGILAGSNMGIGYVMKFLDSDGVIDSCDGNNIRVSVYIRKFANYDLSFLNPPKKHNIHKLHKKHGKKNKSRTSN